MNKVRLWLGILCGLTALAFNPPPLNVGLGGVFKVYDAHNQVAGQALSIGSFSAMRTLFRTQGHAFSSCWNVNGFLSSVFVYFPTTDCSGQAYGLDISSQPDIECGQFTIGAKGGTIIFPDITTQTIVNIQSGGFMNADGTVGFCNPEDFIGTMDAFTTITIPTFTPPFRVQ